MKPQESLDAQKFLEDIQAKTLAPSQIQFQLSSGLLVTTNLTQIGNNGTVTYTISSTIPGVPLSGDTEGQTNTLDNQLQLTGKTQIGLPVFNVSFLITTDLDKQQSTAVVTVTATPSGSEYQYSGAIACW